LLSLILSDHPRRFGSRVRRLRQLHDDILEEVAGLRLHLEQQTAGGLDVELVRERASRVIRSIQARRELEADLVYEALEFDLGAW
jgi:hypothetical protein